MPETPIKPDADRAIEHINNDAEALFKKAAALHENLKFKEALSVYDTILKISPNDKKALFRKGICFLCLGGHETAYGCFKAVYEQNPKDIVALLNMAHCLIYTDRIQEAVECYDKLVVLRPHDIDTWNSRGVLLVQLNRIKEGLECFRRGTSIGLVGLEQQFNLDGSYLHPEQYQKALECLENVIKAQPMSNQLLHDAEDAKKYITKIIDLILKVN